MLYKFELVKGIHPGLILERELKNRNLSQRQFAISIDEHPQTLGAIIKKKRKMNLELSLKIEEKLGYDEGYFMTLQIFYDIKQSKIDVNYKPDLTKMRAVTFWDTKIETIDWRQMKVGVIKRVFSYGTDLEQNEIIRFYGKTEVERIRELNPEKIKRG